MGLAPDPSDRVKGHNMHPARAVGISQPSIFRTPRMIFGVAVATAIFALVMWSSFTPSRSGDTPVSPKTPTRIASLTLATDEILSELVLSERLACITFLADDAEMSNVLGVYPKHVLRVRDADPERIIGLRPDLVCVAPYNSADFLKVMERSGLAVYRNEASDSFDAIERGILDLGQQVGEADRALALVERMRERRKRLAQRLAALEQRPRVLFWSAGFTAGRGSTIGEIIAAAGGVNVAADLGLHGSAEIAPEQVIAANPQYILLSRWSADNRQGRIENHPLLRSLAAVRAGRVLVVDGKHLTTVSQFVIEGAERLAQLLHPGKFGAGLPSMEMPKQPRQP